MYHDAICYRMATTDFSVRRPHLPGCICICKGEMDDVDQHMELAASPSSCLLRSNKASCRCSTALVLSVSPTTWGCTLNSRGSLSGGSFSTMCAVTLDSSSMQLPSGRESVSLISSLLTFLLPAHTMCFCPQTQCGGAGRLLFASRGFLPRGDSDASLPDDSRLLAPRGLLSLWESTPSQLSFSDASREADEVSMSAAAASASDPSPKTAPAEATSSSRSAAGSAANLKGMLMVGCSVLAGATSPWGVNKRTSPHDFPLAAAVLVGFLALLLEAALGAFVQVSGDVVGEIKGVQEIQGAQFGTVGLGLGRLLLFILAQEIVGDDNMQHLQAMSLSRSTVGKTGGSQFCRKKTISSVKLAVMELDHGEAGTADHIDFVHTGNTTLKDRGHKVQDLHRRGSGQVNIRQDGVLGAAII
ncbi:hypothetical protein EYF80_015206 [Liparis tanakae]|uniref:Uncharacterized protein n=1 Tax=Liparis tanakae TaxID=230148 RepID=A0A4Z2I997_9TELE|nr:hypothetical protein EYF80_015206 [Liparis tanakae]